MNIPDFNLPPIQLIRPWPQQLAGVQSSRGSSAEPQHEFAEMLYRSVLQNPAHTLPALAPAFLPPAVLSQPQTRSSRPSPSQARSAARAYSPSSRPTVGTLLQTEA
ncbi:MULTISPECIES: hypothetical protein [Chromobacterium]|uniref:Uncharacterized protein n=1 Tax=Chromobacterium amazonense TaxID=1382803 RepID=A0A1S1XA45_9NEIS|nr:MULTISPECIES: hypothetical protein [Chromobacterium]KIA81830.1 hypothetical protein QR66_02590 [Chromobacterium piscinae]MBM2884982.1 hypothetical protein [Chromobacterium amazonense]MDE1714658.1 hypothetical protein [Chromobacterium amazonense]MDQ4540429.1 hypothetical protein [Chromobacterium amazonense]OHX16591.1 hypothetical protein BI343_14595 [Chromobacterium amazonense]